MQGTEDVRAFFDGIAERYGESHGAPDILLSYRLSIIGRLLGTDSGGALLEIGCGTGIHLFALAERFREILGTDLSKGMIEAAERRREAHPKKASIRLTVDPGEKLATVRDSQVDVVLCVGALEHMLDKRAVLAQVRRVLKPKGLFICLTPNGSYIWYSRLAPRLGLATRHLSTDRFLTPRELLSELKAAGLNPAELGFWSFIPKGDMPGWTARLLILLDRLGKALRIPALRGGLYAKAFK